MLTELFFKATVWDTDECPRTFLYNKVSNSLQNYVRIYVKRYFKYCAITEDILGPGCWEILGVVTAVKTLHDPKKTKATKGGQEKRKSGEKEAILVDDLLYMREAILRLATAHRTLTTPFDPISPKDLTIFVNDLRLEKGAKLTICKRHCIPTKPSRRNRQQSSSSPSSESSSSESPSSDPSSSSDSDSTERSESGELRI